MIPSILFWINLGFNTVEAEKPYKDMKDACKSLWDSNHASEDLGTTFVAPDCRL